MRSAECGGQKTEGRAQKAEGDSDSTEGERDILKGEICFARPERGGYFAIGLSDVVMVALGPLEASVMVRIHAGQPFDASNDDYRRKP